MVHHQMIATRCTIAASLLWAGSSMALSGAHSDRGDIPLQDRIAELEAQVARMKAHQGDEWLTEARAQEIRSLVQDVLNDADTRTSLLQGGTTGGWDEGFFLASADGNFRVNVQGQLQFRYVFNNQDDDDGGSIDTTRQGFENRRTKLIFTGNVVDPSVIYRIEANFDDEGGDFFLEDAFVGKALGNGWTLVGGQLKVPLMREFLVHSSKQQLVERSLVSGEFDAQRTQGVAVDYRNDWFHGVFGYTDGHFATGGFNQPALAMDTEYSLTGRAEFLLAGNWDQFNDLSSWKGEEFGLMLGAAAHFQDGEFGTPDAEAEVFQWTFDASAEFGGASVFGYFVGRHIDISAGGGQLDQYGAVLQGGFFLTDEWELFGRYEWGDDDLSEDDLSVITVGATRYFKKHQLKWSTDVGFALEAIGATWGDGFLGIGGEQAGWRTDPTDNDGQVVVRSQIQLLF